MGWFFRKNAVSEQDREESQGEGHVFQDVGMQALFEDLVASNAMGVVSDTAEFLNPNLDLLEDGIGQITTGKFQNSSPGITKFVSLVMLPFNLIGLIRGVIQNIGDQLQAHKADGRTSQQEKEVRGTFDRVASSTGRYF